MTASHLNPSVSASPTVRDYLEERGYNEWDPESSPADGRERFEALSVQVALVREPAANARPKLGCKWEVAEVFQPFAELDREHLAVAFVGDDRRLNGIHLVSIGSRNTAPCEIANVFKAAILTNSSSLILVHNHPSGRTDPSRNDIELTKHLLEAGKIMGIPLDDHIIIGENGYQSIIDRGRLRLFHEETDADEIPRVRPKSWAPKPIALPTLTENDIRRDHPTAELWRNPHKRLGLEEGQLLWADFTDTATKEDTIVIGGPPQWSPRLWNVKAGRDGLELNTWINCQGRICRRRKSWKILATVIGIASDLAGDVCSPSKMVPITGRQHKEGRLS
jgi:proteasome lid subunit RPN8/RPN11